MRTSIAFVLTLVISGIVADSCDERAEQCIGNAMDTEYDPTNHQQFCAEVIPVLNCLKDIEDECLDDEELKEDFNRLSEALGQLCDLDTDDGGVLSCIGSEEFLEEEGWRCAELSIPEVISKAALFETEDDLKCEMIAQTADCMVKSLSDKCGSFMSDLISTGVREGITESLTYSDDSKHCQELYGGGRRKKRSLKVRLPSFAKKYLK